MGVTQLFFSRDICIAIHKYIGSEIICQVFRKTYLYKPKRYRVLIGSASIYATVQFANKQLMLNNNRCKLDSPASNPVPAIAPPHTRERGTTVCEHPFGLLMSGL